MGIHKVEPGDQITLAESTNPENTVVLADQKAVVKLVKPKILDEETFMLDGKEGEGLGFWMRPES